LIDLAFGLLLIISFTASIADTYRYAAYVLLLLVGPLLALAKRKITAPRMGAVEFGPARKARKRHVVVVITALVVATALVAVLVGNTGWLQRHPEVLAFLFGTMIFAAFAAVAYWLELARMYAVGVLFGGAFTVTELSSTQIPLLIAGTLVAISGAVRLRRFLRSYDAATAEAGDGG
jgi:hypothetical protein